MMWLMITPLRVKKGPERSAIKIFSRGTPAAFLGDRRITSISQDARCNFPPFDGATFRRGAEQRPFYGTATKRARRKESEPASESAEPGQVSWPLNACVVSQFFPFFFLVAGCRHRRTTERVRRTAPHIGALPGESNFACDRQNP